MLNIMKKQDGKEDLSHSLRNYWQILQNCPQKMSQNYPWNPSKFVTEIVQKNKFA